MKIGSIFYDPVLKEMGKIKTSSMVKIQSMKNLSLKEDFFTVRQMESMK